MADHMKKRINYRIRNLRARKINTSLQGHLKLHLTMFWVNRKTSKDHSSAVKRKCVKRTSHLMTMIMKWSWQRRLMTTWFVWIVHRNMAMKSTNLMKLRFHIVKNLLTYHLIYLIRVIANDKKQNRQRRVSTRKKLKTKKKTLSNRLMKGRLW